VLRPIGFVAIGAAAGCSAQPRDRQRKCSVAAWKTRMCDRTLVVDGEMVQQMAVCTMIEGRSSSSSDGGSA
jgi:hypothetical protein